MAETIRPSQRTFTGKISDGDIRPLRVFCAVTRCGGFAAAESELQIGLPSISRSMKDLETRLGVTLCRRGRVGFALTEQGRQVYEASLRLIADLDRFESDIRGIQSDLAGTLTVGVIDSVVTDANLRLPEALAAFKTKNPGVALSISTMTSNLIEQSVLDDTLLCGMVVGRRRVNRLDYRLLYRERTSLYCSERHPLYAAAASAIRLEDLARHDYVGYAFMEDADRPKIGVLLNKTASVDCMEAVAMLVSSGCYIGTLPDHYVRSVWRLKGFRPVLPEVFSSLVDIELVTRRGAASPLTAAFVGMVDAAAQSRGVPGARPVQAAGGLLATSS